MKMKNESEKETRERRTELQRYEKRVLSKEEAVDKKARFSGTSRDQYYSKRRRV